MADLAMLQAQDLLDGIDLSIAIDLGHTSVPHIQQLSPAYAILASLSLCSGTNRQGIADHSQLSATDQVAGL